MSYHPAQPSASDDDDILAVRDALELGEVRSRSETARLCGVSEDTVKRIERMFAARLAMAILQDSNVPPSLQQGPRRRRRSLSNLRSLTTMSVTEHPSIPAGTSQCACILSELQLQAGEWVSMARLHVSSGSMNVHSRIADLRKRGHTIDHKNERPKGRTAIHSFYRLVLPEPQS